MRGAATNLAHCLLLLLKLHLVLFFSSLHRMLLLLKLHLVLFFCSLHRMLLLLKLHLVFVFSSLHRGRVRAAATAHQSVAAALLRRSQHLARSTNSW